MRLWRVRQLVPRWRLFRPASGCSFGCFFGLRSCIAIQRVRHCAKEVIRTQIHLRPALHAELQRQLLFFWRWKLLIRSVALWLAPAAFSAPLLVRALSDYHLRITLINAHRLVLPAIKSELTSHASNTCCPRSSQWIENTRVCSAARDRRTGGARKCCLAILP